VFPLQKIIAHQVFSGLFGTGVFPGSAHLAQGRKEMPAVVPAHETVILHVPARRRISHRRNAPNAGACVSATAGRDVGILGEQPTGGQRRPGKADHSAVQKSPPTHPLGGLVRDALTS
jgi:hypothetical protein